MICFPLPISSLSTANPILSEHKKGIFVRFAISMTQDVDPRDNVIAERVNGILKTEWLYDNSFIGFDNGYRRVAEVINLYNNKEMNFKQKKRVACVSRILSFIKLLQKKINLLSKVQSHLEGKDLV